MKKEFNDKAKDYAKGRPTYAKEVLNEIKALGIHKKSTIADIGAGTGLLTNLVGELGCSVLAVEPNSEMIHQCQEYCFIHPNIQYHQACAEKTQLDAHSIDLITIAQAFHWFDKAKCKIEFQRILKDGGYVMTVWNEMQENHEFSKNYLNLIHEYAVKTTAGNGFFNPHQEKLNFFGQDYQKTEYDYFQTLTEEELLANAASLSYTPSKLDAKFTDFKKALHQLFDAYQENGIVNLHYKTEICIGQFAK